MTIVVDLRPEVQAELARQAAAHGRPVEAYAASLLEEAVELPSQDQTKINADRRKRKRAPGKKSLGQLFADSPFKGLDIDFERDRDLGRDIEL